MLVGAKGFKRRGLEGFALAVFGGCCRNVLVGSALRIACDDENRGGGAKPFLIAPAAFGKRLVLQSVLANAAGKTRGVLRQLQNRLGRSRGNYSKLSTGVLNSWYLLPQ